VDTSRSERVDLTLYLQMIGLLVYLVNTRLDIYFAVNSLSQFLVELTRVHWVVAKHVLRYLKGILEYGLWYRQVDGLGLEGFADAD